MILTLISPRYGGAVSVIFCRQMARTQGWGVTGREGKDKVSVEVDNLIESQQ